MKPFGERKRTGTVARIGLLSLAVVAILIAGSGGAIADGGTADAAVDDAVYEADGNTTLVLRLSEPDQSVVATAEDPSATLRSHARQTQPSVVSAASELNGVSVERRFWITNAIVVSVDRTDPATVRRLASIDGVERIHPNYEFDTPDPVDTDLSGAAETRVDERRTNINDTENVTYGLDQIRAPEAWEEFNTSGEGVSVAVLDTGVDPDHPDIDFNESNFAAFDEEGNVPIDADPGDDNGHGTHVSGTVVGGNASGTRVGVAPDAELYHARVLGDEGGTFASVAAGIEWALGEDVDVIVMSLGASGYNDAILDQVQAAREVGALPVVAAGNGGEDTSISPGNYPESFSVGATTPNETIAYFSAGERIDTREVWENSSGELPNPDWPEEYVVPDVVAPGFGVYSTFPDGEYGRLDGTSMATPHVAGVAALIASAEENATVSDLEEAIVRTTRKPDGNSDRQDPRFGYGIVDARSAIEYATTDTGINGTVVDENGDPVEGVGVELAGSYTTTTDENGSFEVVSFPGNETLSVTEFGYKNVTRTVTVPENGTATVTIEIESTVDAAVLDGAPTAVRAGQQEIRTRLETINAETITVTTGGDFEGSLSLRINGSSAQFGNSVSITDGTVPVNVSTESGSNGTLDLAYEIADGTGGTIVLESTTFVENDPVEIAVVGGLNATKGENERAVANALEGQLPNTYFADPVNANASIDTITAYDAVVVNYLPDNETAATVVDAIDGAEVPAVYLDMFGPQTNAITKRSNVTGDPKTVVKDLGDEPRLLPQVEHPILEGVPAQPEGIAIHTDDDIGDHAAVSGARGRSIAEVQVSGEVVGDTLVVDEFNRTVLAASFGRAYDENFIAYDDYTETGNRILANTVKYTYNRQPGTLKGSVSGPNGTGLDNVTVQLQRPDGTARNVSVEDGSYEVAVTADTYTVRVVGEGYDPVVREVTVDPEATTVEDFDVEEESPVDVETVAPAPQSVLAGEPIEATFEVQDVDNVTITRSGDYTGEPDLAVYDFAQEFGDPIPLNNGSVDVLVSTDEMDRGFLELTYQFRSDGEARTITTETTVNAAPENASFYANADGVVRTRGLQGAVSDWQAGTIDVSLLLKVIDAWSSGTPIA